jgi:hypothetical protein
VTDVKAGDKRLSLKTDLAATQVQLVQKVT